MATEAVDLGFASFEPGGSPDLVAPFGRGAPPRERAANLGQGQGDRMQHKLGGCWDVQNMSDYVNMMVMMHE